MSIFHLWFCFLFYCIIINIFRCFTFSSHHVNIRLSSTTSASLLSSHLLLSIMSFMLFTSFRLVSSSRSGSFCFVLFCFDLFCFVLSHFPTIIIIATLIITSHRFLCLILQPRQSAPAHARYVTLCYVMLCIVSYVIMLSCFTFKNHQIARLERCSGGWGLHRRDPLVGSAPCSVLCIDFFW